MTVYGGTVELTTDILGVIVLFIPYVIVILPYLRNRSIKKLQSLYLHKTPRTEWNHAVDEFPPRRITGYCCAIVLLLTPCIFLLVHHSTNNFWVDLIQYFIYLSLPTILSIIRPQSHQPCDITDILILILIIVPIEISEKVDKFLPDVQLDFYTPWQNISLLKLSAFNMGLLIYFIFRPLKDIGFGWDIVYISRFKWVIIRLLLAAIFFCILGIALGISMEYITEPSKMSNVFRDGIGKFFAFFILEALPLEFFFRGILQNLMHSFLDFRAAGEAFLSNDDALNNPYYRLSEEEDSNNHLNLGNYKQYPSLNNININIYNNKKDKIRDNDIENNEIVINDADNNKDSVLLYGDYYDFESDDGTVKSYINKERDTFDCSKGFCYFLFFPNYRDYACLVFASLLYAVTSTKWDYDSGKDVVVGFVLIFWLGLSCGWVWRHTNSCFVSAVLSSLVVFLAKYVFSDDETLCKGAC